MDFPGKNDWKKKGIVEAKLLYDGKC